MSEDNLSDECFEGFRDVIHKMTGITIDANRKTMLIGRIRKRVNELELASYDDYLSYLGSHRNEEKNFVNLITTNETYFYRTPRVWDFIEKEFLPNCKSGHVNIWSAASSTGDEAHTLGIVCQNYKDQKTGFSYSVTGTDISSSVVERAADGLYIGRPVQRFREAREDLFKKYMVGDDTDGFRVIPKIKSNIKFQTHNLFNSYKSNQKFDLVLLRNVLIYFTREDQEKVLKNIFNCLNPNGFLVIGESESLTRIDSDFVLISPFIYRPKNENDIEKVA
jgi:chemotaxis protein methyltransferase CheR